jgi:hypothetical protein
MFKMPTKATIPLPKISFVKRKERSQLYRIATIDGRVKTIELPVDAVSAYESKSNRAFLVDPDNQFINEDGIWVQVVGETSAFPMTTRVHREIEEQQEIINKIFHDTKARDKLAQFLKRGQSEFMTKLLWLVGMPTIAILLMFGLSWLKR